MRLASSARVAPREGRVSRNGSPDATLHPQIVAPREGRVSRNTETMAASVSGSGRAPRGACE